jgi:hypothetical protein
MAPTAHERWYDERLRPHRIVEHVFPEIALLLVGAHDGVVALDIAIPAAGDIFGRTSRDIVGAAERVVVLVQAGEDRNLIALHAGREREHREGEREELGRLL